tara:strand:+ start:277 stop:438 length:162 start_codon:yes stop_codon:yes gene_type:complete
MNDYIIDRYYKGINGWTYANSYTTPQEIDAGDEYTELYLTRNIKVEPEPAQYL